MRKSWLLALLLIAALACAGFGASAEEERTRDIVILFTGDVHCAVDDNIGYAGLSAYKATLVANGYAVLVVDTGDAIQGAALGAFSRGESIIEIMNAVGYDAMALGNHEFDYEGPARLDELQEIAEFPFLSANLREIATGEALYPPYVIIEADGVNIAFVGVSTPETLTSSTPRYFMNDAGEFIYEFMADETGERLWACVQESVDAARAEGADYVVVLSHLGISATTAPYISSYMIENTTGIDAVLDGHSHSVLPGEKVLNKDGQAVALASTGTKLVNIGVMTIDQTGAISTSLVADYTNKDTAVMATIDEMKAEHAEIMDVVTVTLATPLVIEDPETGARIVRNAETNLGDLTADALRHAGGTDIAFINGGGVRVTLPVGDVTYGQILSVMPFGNILCTVAVDGQTILDALEFGARAVPEESGGFIQVSGLTYEIHTTIPSSVVMDGDGLFVAVEGEYRVKNVLVGGEPLDLEAQYTLTSHNYMLKNLGDGYTMFGDCELLRDEFMIDADALAEYLKTVYPEDPDKYADPYGEGRITLVE